ncbi:hypothetical protein [Bacillus ndiopicus]|uniref:hypothetical protein n=1 Tax=Bacillus ndiopicus TaxID=1347368 RepID=UPI0012B5DAE9|nr:hypothetical protein [Bacillus ndiopicus]
MPYNQIVYEDKQYKFIKTIRKADAHIDVYRNKEDQHTVKIHLVDSRPYYIDAYYRVEVLHAIV